MHVLLETCGRIKVLWLESRVNPDSGADATVYLRRSTILFSLLLATLHPTQQQTCPRSMLLAL